MAVRMANCFARKQNGTLMPGILKGRDQEGCLVVQAVGSEREYSFPPEHVLSLEEAWRSIRWRRLQTVLGNYVFEPVLDEPRVVRCFDPRHPRRSNYILAQGPIGWTCTCPAFARAHNCKHLAAHAKMDAILTPLKREEETSAMASTTALAA